jgi:signal transduction histidine kinase
MGDCFTEMGEYDSAFAYVQESLDIAILLGSKSKEADSYALMAKFYERTAQYKKALDFQKKWYHLDTALVNESSSKTIAELQERFHASEREKQNQLLMAEVGKQKIRNTYLSFLTAGVIVIGLLVAVFLVVYRRANRKLKEVNLVIGKQKEKLAALNQEKNSLISIVSHDLSSPFASIDMWSQLLHNGKNLNAEQLQALEKIQHSAQNGERLIRNILEIERQGTTGKPLEIEETNISALIAHVVTQFQPKAAAKQIVLQGPEPDDNIFLLTDQDLLRRIVENLVSNALKFTPAGRYVWVRLADAGKQVELKVIDQGLGIPEQEQKKLFTKYAQLSNQPTAGESSHGLGLSIVKRLVSELNGSISCTSEVGKGTEFLVIFPK